jgi:hypothetical protein
VTKQKSPLNWPLILCLYVVAAIVLVIVRDDLGTDNDPQLKAGGWIALTFAVYWSFRGLFAWVAAPNERRSEEVRTEG